MLVLLAALCAVLVVAAELGCRRWLRRRSRYCVWTPNSRLEVRLDPEVFAGFPPRPRFDINTDGERGAEVRGDTQGLFRVLVAGGSAAECFALDQGASLSGVLERHLSTCEALETLGARRAHVGSIARSGIACRHLDLVFERVLPQYGDLSAIAIMVGAAEVAHWLEQGAPPVEDGAPVRVATTFASHPEQPFGWKPQRWAAVELAKRLRRRWLRPVEVREAAGAWMRAARRMRAQAKEVRTDVPDATVLLDRFEYHFARLLECAKSFSDRVLVVRQPWFAGPYTAEEMARFWHGGVGRVWKDKVEVFYSLEVVDRLMHMVDARARAVADAAGVEQLDLPSVVSPTLENFYDLLHFTPAGAELVGSAVAAALLRPHPSGVLHQRAKTVSTASATRSMSSGFNS